jgi:Putative zinc- or iron-chelating domain
VTDGATGEALPVATVRRRLDSIFLRQSNVPVHQDGGSRPPTGLSPAARLSTRATLTTAHAPPRMQTKVRVLRRTRNALVYAHAMISALVARPDVLFQKSGRTILWGKIRRALICLIPGLAVQLKRKHGLAGGCVSCGTSCNLLFRCPHWDPASHLCSIYDDRPMTCRQFPMTPADLVDRDLASGTMGCGYRFVGNNGGTRPAWLSEGEMITMRRETTAGRHAPALRHVRAERIDR